MILKEGPTNVSEAMVQYLKAAGLGQVFGYPGDPNVEFMEAARRGGMRFVLGRREGTAGLTAEACGFLTGRRSVHVHARAGLWRAAPPLAACSLASVHSTGRSSSGRKSIPRNTRRNS